MEQFRTVVHFLTVASLFLAAAQIYLTLNKLWNRKHERVVAESISIMGETLGLVPLLLLTMTFTLDRQWEGAVDGALWLGAGAVTILIGSGRWVEGKRKRSFWKLLWESVTLERSEVGDLAKSLIRPSNARLVLEILRQVALLDAHLDARERDFLEAFASEWGLDLVLDVGASESGSGSLDLMHLRESVATYLATSPPDRQVIELRDVITALIKVDAEVSDEEELMLAELTGMFDQYVLKVTGLAAFGVAVVPQSPQQDDAIAALLPGLARRSIAGGEAYVVGPYFSDSFAAVVGEQYRRLGFFSTVVELDTVYAAPGTIE